MDMQKVGDNIRKLRELKNFTQDYLADKAGIARETLGKIEKGEPGTKLDTVFKIAAVLEVRVTEIFDFDPQQFFNHSNNNAVINGSNSQVHPPSNDLLKMLFESFQMMKEQHVAILEKLNRK